MTKERRGSCPKESLPGYPSLTYLHHMSFYKLIHKNNPENFWKTPYSSPLLVPAMTSCEGTNTSTLPPQQEQESCAACLYTGMATCTGLSLYFFKMALLDLPEEGTTAFTKQVKTNKRFLLGCGTFWAAAGIYRWSLGWLHENGHCVVWRFKKHCATQRVSAGMVGTQCGLVNESKQLR